MRSLQELNERLTQLGKAPDAKASGPSSLEELYKRQSALLGGVKAKNQNVLTPVSNAKNSENIFSSQENKNQNNFKIKWWTTEEESEKATPKYNEAFKNLNSFANTPNTEIMRATQASKPQYVNGTKAQAIFDAINPVANIEVTSAYFRRIAAAGARKSIDFANNLRDETSNITKQMANKGSSFEKYALQRQKDNLNEQILHSDNFIIRYIASLSTENDGLAQAVEQNKISAIQYLISDADTEFGKSAVKTMLDGVELAKTVAATAATGVPFAVVSGVQGAAAYGSDALNAGHSPERSFVRALAGGTATAATESMGGIGGNVLNKAFGKLASTTVGKALLSEISPKLIEYMGKFAGSTTGKIGGVAFSEGSENVAELYIQNMLDKIILDKNTPVYIKDAAIEFLRGGVLGGVFGSGKAIKSMANNYVNVQKGAAQPFVASANLKTNAFALKPPEIRLPLKNAVDGAFNGKPNGVAPIATKSALSNYQKLGDNSLSLLIKPSAAQNANAPFNYLNSLQNIGTPSLKQLQTQSANTLASQANTQSKFFTTDDLVKYVYKSKLSELENTQNASIDINQAINYTDDVVKNVYKAKLEKTALGAGEASSAAKTGTVWDDIKATQNNIKGTYIPKSFELNADGKQYWVNPNATKHMAEYLSRTLSHGWQITEQQLMSSLKSEVIEATSKGYTYDVPIQIGNWELIFSQARQVGQLPVIKHALYIP